MKKTISLLLFALACFATQAQTINADSLISYSSAVIAKVYEVGSKIDLTITEQKSIADLFAEEEIAIANLIIAEASKEDIEASKSVFTYRFNHLLPAQKINDYYKAVASSKGNRIAKLNASFLKQKYGTTDMMKQYFNDMFSWREQLIEENFLRYRDTMTIDTNVYNIIQAYDTLLEKYIRTSQSQAFINSKIDIIKNIDASVDVQKLQNLQNTYSNLVFQYPDLSFKDHFNTALNFNFNQISDTPFYVGLYKNQILFNAYFTSKNAVEAYTRQYRLAQTGVEKIKPIVANREYEVAVINKLYINYTPIRDSITDSIFNKYRNEIDNIVVRYSLNQSQSQFDLAINYATHLNLTEQQITQLNIRANEYNELKKEFLNRDATGEYTNKEFESSYMSEILTSEQYTLLLTIKYKSLSEDIAKKDWAFLEQLNISQHFPERATTELELTNYHLALFIAYHRNAHNKQNQLASIGNIKEIMPEAMRMLIDKWTLRSPYEYNPDVFFQW